MRHCCLKRRIPQTATKSLNVDYGHGSKLKQKDFLKGNNLKIKRHDWKLFEQLDAFSAITVPGLHPCGAAILSLGWLSMIVRHLRKTETYNLSGCPTDKGHHRAMACCACDMAVILFKVSHDKSTK